MKVSVLIVAGAITASVIIYLVRREQLADNPGDPFPQSLDALPARSPFASPLDNDTETNYPIMRHTPET